MGKLNIAHHKSYHPYRADNVARVRADEEAARAADADADARAGAADAEARMDALRARAGVAFAPATPSTSSAAQPAASGSGHINLFADLESHEAALHAAAAKRAPAQTNADRGVALAPSKDDLSPWYASQDKEREGGKGKRAGWAAREQRRKSSADPLSAIPPHLRLPAAPPPRTPSSSAPQSATQSRLARESSERARAQALVARRKAERARAEGSATPSTVLDTPSVAGDLYNREAVEEARRERMGGRGWRAGDLRGRRWDDGR